MDCYGNQAHYLYYSHLAREWKTKTTLNNLKNNAIKLEQDLYLQIIKSCQFPKTSKLICTQKIFANHVYCMWCKSKMDRLSGILFLRFIVHHSVKCQNCNWRGTGQV